MDHAQRVQPRPETYQRPDFQRPVRLRAGGWHRAVLRCLRASLTPPWRAVRLEACPVLCLPTGRVFNGGAQGMDQRDSQSPAARVTAHPVSPDTLLVSLAGHWRLEEGVPDSGPVCAALESNPAVRHLKFDTAQLTGWSSSLVAFLHQCQELCHARRIRVDWSGLPDQLRRLLELAAAAPGPPPVRAEGPRLSWLGRVGLKALEWKAGILEGLRFVGEVTLAVGRWLRGQRSFRKADAWLLAQQAGAEALPIVALIAALVGMILAFVGAVQLESFGASIYVADLVAIAMAREMGCMMTAIIMCGRTGASYAAALGTMKVNQELDAFAVFGISTLDFLVLPRLLALVAMMPLLTVFADVVGVLGGFVVAMSMLELSPVEYWLETRQALTLTQFSTGLIKSVAFAVVIGLTACLRGLQCGTDAAAVGRATTSAVVTGITWIIATDAVFAVLYNALGI